MHDRTRLARGSTASQYTNDLTDTSHDLACTRCIPPLSTLPDQLPPLSCARGVHDITLTSLLHPVHAPRRAALLLEVIIATPAAMHSMCPPDVHLLVVVLDASCSKHLRG